MKTALLFFSLLLLCGCAAKKHPAQPAPAPPAIEAAKPKPRPIRPGDMVLKHAEVLPDSTVVCHRPIQVIDAKKQSEAVNVYQCR